MPKVSEEHREARRDQILRAAMRCAAREGFHKTTMSAVIRESGMSAGAVYLYFRSKAELIQAMAGIAVSGLADTITAMVEADDVVPPEVAVRRCVERILEIGDEFDVELPRLALQAWAEAARDPEVLTLVSGEALKIRGAWVGYARRATDAGFLAPDADAEAVGLTLMSLIPGFMLFQVAFDDVSPDAFTAGIGEIRRG